MNIAVLILAMGMASALLAILWLRDNYDWPTDTQLLIMGAVFVVAGAVMFSKCGGWLCSFGAPT